MIRRKMISRILFIGLTACFFFYARDAAAQKVETSIDRQDILIGEQLKYTVKASFPSNTFKVHWFSVPDSIAHFEVVDRGKIDSAIDNNITTFLQTITYTSFDSGRWNTPGLMINFDPVKDDTSLNLYTDSIPVNVSYSPSDSTGLRDIKPIMDVKVTDYFWYYVAGAILTLLLIILLLWNYFKKKKNDPIPKTPGLSAYDEAMAALNKLKKYDLDQKDEIRAYHTKLSEIFRRYIGRKQNKNLFNSTSSDVLILLSAFFNSDDIATIAAVLRTGDAVKFAKYIPSAIESEESIEKIITVIKLIEQRSKEKTQ